jgi:hypothetical protein
MGVKNKFSRAVTEKWPVVKHGSTRIKQGFSEANLVGSLYREVVDARVLSITVERLKQ